MKIGELLAEGSIALNGVASSKQEALNEMVALMAKSGNITDVEAYRKGGVRKRGGRNHRNWRGYCDSAL